MSVCVLAYSGGLDTSCMLSWLIERGNDVHAVYVDLGQPGEDRQLMKDKAVNIGAKSVRIVDAREELCRDFAFPCVRWQAKYEGPYRMGTSIARPLITRKIRSSRRGRCPGLCPRCDKAKRPVPFSLGSRSPAPRHPSLRTLADPRMARVLSGSSRNDRVLRTARHPRQSHRSKTLFLG